MPLPWITLIAPCFHTRLWIGLSIIPSGERSPVLETWLSLGSGATWWSLSCPPLWWSQGGYNTGRDWLREASRFLELCISVFFCMFWGYIFYCTIKVWEKIMCCSHNCVVEFTSSLQSLLPFSIFIFNFQPPFFSSFSLPFPSSFYLSPFSSCLSFPTWSISHVFAPQCKRCKRWERKPNKVPAVQSFLSVRRSISRGFPSPEALVGSSAVTPSMDNRGGGSHMPVHWIFIVLMNDIPGFLKLIWPWNFFFLHHSYEYSKEVSLWFCLLRTP